MYAGSTKAPHEAGFDAYCVGYGKGSAPMRDGYSINIYILRSVFHFSFPATDTFGCNERCRVSYHTITCNSYTHHTLTGALTPTTHTHTHTHTHRSSHAHPVHLRQYFRLVGPFTNKVNLIRGPINCIVSTPFLVSL